MLSIFPVQTSCLPRFRNLFVSSASHYFSAFNSVSPILRRPSVLPRNQRKMEKEEPQGVQHNECLLFLCGRSSLEIDVANRLKDANNLKVLDEEIKILTHSDLQNYVFQESFSSQIYMDSLKTDYFGRFLIWSPRLSSTHDLISQNFTELPLGSVCVADVQYKGRGRSKNIWESPLGSLLFSFTLQMENGRILPLVQYVVSLAMTEAIKMACQTNNLPHLDVRIKWPNDLFMDGLKIGGILCTSTYKSNKFNVCAGIGLNVDNEKPTISLNSALEKLTTSTLKLRREDILASFFEKFETLFDVFMKRGFQPLEKLYCNTWLHSGQKVVIEENIEGHVKHIAVTIKGLTPSGYLLASGDDNHNYELHPDGNRFDFFRGLVRRKIE